MTLLFPLMLWNNLRGDAIRLGAVYACGESYDEIIEAILLMDELSYDKFILEV